MPWLPAKIATLRFFDSISPTKSWMIFCAQAYSGTNYDAENFYEKKKLKNLWYTLLMDEKGWFLANFVTFTLVSLATINIAVQYWFLNWSKWFKTAAKSIYSWIWHDHVSYSMFNNFLRGNQLMVAMETCMDIAKYARNTPFSSICRVWFDLNTLFKDNGRFYTVSQ